jgi:ribonucleoside-diphosphate reductase alpha chain
MLEAITRLISLSLRAGVDPASIVEHLTGISCCPVWDAGTLVNSPSDAVAIALGRHLEDEQGDAHAAQLRLFTRESKRSDGNGAGPQNRCPECGSHTIFQEGCLLCTYCGWNKCG